MFTIKFQKSFTGTNRIENSVFSCERYHTYKTGPTVMRVVIESFTEGVTQVIVSPTFEEDSSFQSMVVENSAGETVDEFRVSPSTGLTPSNIVNIELDTRLPDSEAILKFTVGRKNPHENTTVRTKFPTDADKTYVTRVLRNAARVSQDLVHNDQDVEYVLYLLSRV